LSIFPSIKSIVPDLGPVTGGTLITITGTDFGSGVVVDFDGTPATSVQVVSKTKITAFTPALAQPGPADVFVENADGGLTVIDSGFNYVAVAAAPQIVSADGGNGVAVLHVAKPHVSEAVENYQYSLDDGLTWNRFDPAQVLSPLTIARLANGQQYTIRPRAISVAGFGEMSAAVTVTGWNAEIGTWIQLFFSGPTAPAASGPMYYECRSASTNWVPCNSGWILPALNAGMPYDLKVRAVNDGGAGAPDSIAITTKTRVKAPTTRPIITRVITGKGMVNLVITKPAGATRYDVTYNAWSPTQKKWIGWSTWTKAGITKAGNLFVGGLQSRVKYVFNVRAANIGGFGPASTSSAQVVVL
jgi:hypothetical protein